MNKSLLELVQASGDIGSLQAIEGKEKDQQIDELKVLFLLALKQNNDEAAKKFASWILYAIDPEFEQHIKRERIQKAIDIWNLIKTFKVERSKVLNEKYQAKRDPGDSFEGYLSFHKISEFDMTRAMLLTDIIKWWQYAHQAADSDEVFKEFLIDELFRTRSSKTEQELVRKGTEYFNVDRLLKHIVLLRSKENVDEELLKIILVGWARNLRATAAMNKLPIVEPLANCSEEAHSLVESFSKKMVTFDHDVKYLLWVLGGTFKGEQPQNYSEYESLYGTECTFFYKSLDCLEVNLEMTGVESTFKEKEGHDWFEKARTNIKLWQEKYEHGVDLKVSVKDKYNKKQIFSRGEELLIKY